MSAEEEYGAIAAALMGVLAISAAKSGSTSNESVPKVAEGNGIWVPEADRDAVIKMINKAASKEYYIDANGFVKEVPGTAENLSKSSTYSSVLDRLINGNNKVVIGVDDGWVSYGENGLEANAFTGGNSGITVGDNGTPQVVIVTGQDTAESSADVTLAHELTHALRGEMGLKSINAAGGINQDEEAHTIEVENQIRKELGYAVRKDGDSSDDGDGSYGKYSNALEEKDWYNNIDKLQGTDKLSGNAYSNSILGAVVAAVASAVASIFGGSGSSSSSHHHSSSKPEWGTNYDDSVWGNVIESAVETLASFEDDSSSQESKWDWDDFWKPVTSVTSGVSNSIWSTIGTAISGIASALLGIPLGQLFNLGSKPKTGWIKESDGTWYYYNNSGQKQIGWVQDNGKWYYLNSDGKMQTGWVQDGNWYYLDPSGAMQTGWVQDKKDGKWYYMNSKGAMETGWVQDNDKWYYIDSKGVMQTGWIRDGNKDYYLYSNGEMAPGWVKDGNTYYYFDSNGKMETGWKNIDGKEYYLDSDGKMKTGWIGDDYYLYSNGQMATGWVKKSDNTWYYFNKSTGKMENGWIEDDGSWYYLTEKGEVKTGWMRDGDKWYYLDESGKMVEDNWAKDQYGNWYYLDSSGEMVKDKWVYDKNNGYWYRLNSDGIPKTGWITEGSKCYYLYSGGQMAEGWMQDGEDYYYFHTDNGNMATTTWIQGEGSNEWYFVGDDGKMITDQWQDKGEISFHFSQSGIVDAYSVIMDGKTHYFNSNDEEMDDGSVEYDETLDNIISALTPGGGVSALIKKGAIKAGEKILLKEAGKEIIEGAGNASAKELIGKDFEEYLTKKVGGEGSFSKGGRDFDGGIGNRWWEAKSGQYWDLITNNSKKLELFKSSMGDRLRIAKDNGATYELFSNSPIPQEIKDWLTKKGIPYTELLD